MAAAAAKEKSRITERVLKEFMLRENLMPQQIRAQISDFKNAGRVEDEASANELLRKHGKMFSFWVCVMDDDTEGVYRSCIPMARSLFSRVGTLASVEAFEHVPLEARERYIDMITSRLKAGKQSEADLQIYHSVVDWFKLKDVVDRALQLEDGLVGAACKLLLDENSDLSMKMVYICLGMIMNMVNGALLQGEKAFRLALSRGVLLVAVRAARLPHVRCHPAEDVSVIAANLLRMLANMAPLLVKALKEGTETRCLADSVLKAGGTSPAKTQLRKLVELEKINKIANSTIDVPETANSSTEMSASCKLCRNCSKMDATMKCSKCLNAYYCNKGCQRQDFKVHKARCSPPQDGLDLRLGRRGKLVPGYLVIHGERLRTDLMAKRFEQCSTGAGEPLQVQEMVVMVNLDTLTDSILLLEDVRAWKNLPSWLTESTFPQSAVLEMVEEMHAKLLPGMWLVLYKDPGQFGGVGVLRSQSGGDASTSG